MVSVHLPVQGSSLAVLHDSMHQECSTDSQCSKDFECSMSCQTALSHLPGNLTSPRLLHTCPFPYCFLVLTADRLGPSLFGPAQRNSPAKFAWQLCVFLPPSCMIMTHNYDSR